ncbi:MAG: shikimate dehydrogenase [Porphyrobacter sp.]|nr:shikimate dehydrogenase [Porphyrobacter sp.]
MRPYAEVIGDPIAQSKSPAIHNFWLEKLGIDAEYRACHVRPEELGEYLAARNADDDWRGCNVTMPHKQAVLPLLDTVSPTAERIGAVNTVVMRDYLLHGDNTDAPGFMEPLGLYETGQTYRFAMLVGTGGAARAIADALQENRWTIISYSRDPAKAEREIGRYIWDKDLICPLEDLARSSHPELIPSDADRIDILVNASAMGMAGYPDLAVDLDGIVEDLIVYDIVTHPLETRLIRQARAKGLRTIDGLAMLIGQAAVAFEKFFGQPAPREHDAELRAILTS